MGTERVLGVPTLGHPKDVPARSWLSTLPTHLPGEGALPGADPQQAHSSSARRGAARRVRPGLRAEGAPPPWAAQSCLGLVCDEGHLCLS